MAKLSLSSMLLVATFSPVALAEVPPQTAPLTISPVPPPTRLFDNPSDFEEAEGDGVPAAEMEEVRTFLHVQDAVDFVETNDNLVLDGKGLCVAILDTGLRTTHRDFNGRVAAQRNFTTDNGGDPSNATDGNGHGTNVAGIIAAGDIHTGIAPNANVIPLKVLRNSNGGSFDAIRQALEWVREHRDDHNISVVNMSLGDSGNYTSDNFGNDAIGNLISELRDARVAVVVAAGNDFFTHNSQQGMGYPAIFRASVSVGAVYDANEGGFGYSSGAQTSASSAGQITPFSQRLHKSVSATTCTDIFAPGAPVTASGHTSDTGVSTQHGTSQASPVTAGLILLMQQYYKHHTGELPSVDKIETWLREGGIGITDNYGDIDNVANTGLSFTHVDAEKVIKLMHEELTQDDD
jgi:subtilisin family serine protease